MENKENTPEWKLDSISIYFRKGFNHLNTQDRYEGKIKFTNSDEESFEFKIREDLSRPYIDLIAEDIVKNAKYLGERLVDSLGLNKTVHPESQPPNTNKEKIR
jgi:hypothetical protein